MGNSGLIRRDFATPFLKALFARLDGTKPKDIAGVDVRVCDFIQKDGPFPYVQIGVTDQPKLWDCKQEAGIQLLAPIRIWDNQETALGMKNINKIGGEVLTIVTTTDLDLTADGMRVGHYRISGPNGTLPREPNGILSRVISILFFITDTTTVQT